MSNREISCIFTQSAAAAAAVAALCGAILLLLLQHQFCCFLLLFVVVSQMANFVAASLNLILLIVFSFFSFKRDYFRCTSWQYCVAFTASICLHPRLRACAEPRRASARRVQSSLMINFFLGETLI